MDKDNCFSDNDESILDKFKSHLKETLSNTNNHSSQFLVILDYLSQIRNNINIISK
jgi:hypothetical protein